MGFLNELKKLTRPYDDEEDEYQDFTPRSAERIPAAPKTQSQARSSYGGFEERRDTNKEIARRILDFLSGVAYAQDGKIKKVAVSTYLITPYNVDLMGDLIDELENSGLYF